MFFGYGPFGTYSTGNFKLPVQIWEARIDFETFFMVKGKTQGGLPVSAVVDIYNNYFPEATIAKESQVWIKQGDKAERTQLIQKLKENNITNWTTTVEGKNTMELFLFDSVERHDKLMKFVRTATDNDGEIYEHDSFGRERFKNLPIIREENTSPDWYMTG